MYFTFFNEYCCYHIKNVHKCIWLIIIYYEKCKKDFESVLKLYKVNRPWRNRLWYIFFFSPRRIREFILWLFGQQMYLSTILFILSWISQSLCVQCSFGKREETLFLSFNDSFFTRFCKNSFSSLLALIIPSLKFFSSLFHKSVCYDTPLSIS